MTLHETLGANLYEGDEAPTSTHGLWIDTTDETHPVIKFHNGSAWVAAPTAQTAATTTYDHTASGLAATNVKTALDEIVARVAALEGP